MILLLTKVIFIFDLNQKVCLRYGTAPMLAWMVEEKDIEPHVPVWDKSTASDYFASGV